MAAPTESFSRNFWSHTAEAPPDTPPLLGAHRSDVTVIGGGYTGLSTALHLAKNGVNVRVLEAKQVG
ncbi:MAG: FAD-dependent oxidoreductase, partial [Alphaproteobacteria bacterium]